MPVPATGRPEAPRSPWGASLAGSLFEAAPRRAPALDPGFRPLSLGLRAFRRALAAEASQDILAIAIEQGNGAVAGLSLDLFPETAGRFTDNLRCASWMLNALLWAHGGWRVTLGGSRELCVALAAEYAPGGRYVFDAELMGRAFGRSFEVRAVDREAVPRPRSRALALGGHLEGCRLGFDLGASDYKVAAVRDGVQVFSAELPWNPRQEPDPAYHFQQIQRGLKLAAAHLPRVDAIGGSSAGILVDGQVRVSSLFRAVPPEVFDAEVRPLFHRLQAAWGVPLEVANDGDVTALAGGMSLGTTGILGIAMGSSEAAGFLDRDGCITGWLNELAFAPVDANPAAGTDDWSGHPGVGAACFSQQAVARLAEAAGLPFPQDMPPADRLREVQGRMERGDGAAARIFDTIGAYLGCALPWYAEFYDFRRILILGRVTSGAGGERILARAREILSLEFPDLAERVSVELPSETSRRVGQAVAAASLPELRVPGGLP